MRGLAQAGAMQERSQTTRVVMGGRYSGRDSTSINQRALVRWRTVVGLAAGRAYDGRIPAELDSAMSANRPPPLSSHRIAIVMSPLGRVLECRDCLLSFSFLIGEQYDAVAKRFDAQLCRSPVGRLEDSANHGTDRRCFVIMQQAGQVSMMASCTKCKNKFFTPTALAHDAIGAERYLLHKYHLHRCFE
jgi:hypothetical protein